MNKIYQILINNVALFYQENEELSIVQLYMTVEGAMRAKTESCGVLMKNGEVISLGKSIGWAKDKKEVDKIIIDKIKEVLGI